MEKHVKELQKEIQDLKKEIQDLEIMVDLPTNREFELEDRIRKLLVQNEDLYDINEKIVKVISSLRKERKELERELMERIDFLREECNKYNRKYEGGNTYY
jgi:phage shock protein A